MNESSRPVCPVCGSDKIVFVGRPQVSQAAKPFVRENYMTAKCNNCIFYFIHPEIELTQDEWSVLYGEGYFPSNPAWWDRKRAEHRQKRLGFLEQFAIGKVNRILDIGCGEGNILIDAFSRGWEAHGLDIYDNRTNEAKRSEIFFKDGNLLDAAYPDNHFDCVYLDSVLEHLIDPLTHIKEINRILRPGGTFYIGVPNENSLFNDIRRLAFTIKGKGKIAVRIQPFKTPFHVSGFTSKSLKKILTDNNFDIPRFSIFAGEYEWLKHKPFTRGFLLNFMMLPVHLLAIPLNKRIYIDTIARKRE